MKVTFGVIFANYLPALLEDPKFCNKCLPGKHYVLRCKECKRVFFGKDVKKDMIKHIAQAHHNQVRLCLENLVETSSYF